MDKKENVYGGIKLQRIGDQRLRRAQIENINPNATKIAIKETFYDAIWKNLSTKFYCVY